MLSRFHNSPVDPDHPPSSPRGKLLKRSDHRPSNELIFLIEPIVPFFRTSPSPAIPGFRSIHNRNLISTLMVK
jgi:hypothetical protein